MVKWSGFKNSSNLIRNSIWHSDVIEMKTMRESFYDELLAGPVQLLATLAKFGKYRSIAEHKILGINFGSGIVFVTDDQRGTAYVFEASVLDPQLVRVIGIDRNRSGNVLEAGAN